MKQFFYFLFSCFFPLGRLRRVKPRRVALLSPHHEQFQDSLGCVGRAIQARGGYETAFLTTADLRFDRAAPLASMKRMFSFFTKQAMYLAHAEYIFLNDNFMPLADLHFSKQTVIVQLWHAEGAFKRFGLHLDLPDNVRKRIVKGNRNLRWVVCSSPAIQEIYAEAFGVSPDRVAPLGSPRTDRFFRAEETEALRAQFLAQYPMCRGKKLVLYAPTFRDDPQENRQLLSTLDPVRFAQRLGEDYMLVLRLHPQMHSGVTVPPQVLDLTDYPDGSALTQLCDVFVTDYSSLCMDALLAGKPCVFYAFDLDRFEGQRSFYFPYTEAPGPIVTDFDQLLDAIAAARQGAPNEKAAAFCAKHLGAVDGKSTERILHTVLKNGKESHGKE